MSEYVCGFPKDALVELADALDRESAVVIKAAQVMDPQRSGGVICIFNRDVSLNVPVLFMVFGKIRPNDALRYRFYAEEKARRLAEHPDHMTSAESADEMFNKYQGAIVAGPYLVSVSGLQAAADESLALRVAVGMEWISPEQAMFIAGVTNNNFYLGYDQLVKKE